MHPKDLRIEDYTYALPDERVAKYPLEIRDSSKLLIYNSGRIEENIYRKIAEHIPEGSLLVFNQTKVVHARLLFRKDTGGIIEVFCLEPHNQYADVPTAMMQKGKVWWKCMIGGASKWKHGMVPELKHENPGFTLRATILERESGTFTLELSWDDDSLSFAEVLHYAGKVPLPPYLHREADTTDEERYQTIYAREEGSVAAPTAGLHFTNDVMTSLDAKGIDLSFLTLHVGAGTFKPVKSETMQEHEMHAEWIEVSRETLAQLISHLETGIVAVGTTSLRTLESLYWIGAKLHNDVSIDFSGIAVDQWEPYEQSYDTKPTESLNAILLYMDAKGINRLLTRTRILIAPGYKMKIVKGLVTNFHQPQSTLLLLVAALIGSDWRKIYEHALTNNYRFLSYGDGCLLWANN